MNIPSDQPPTHTPTTPPPPTRSPDPGSPFVARISWILALVVLGIIIAINQAPNFAPASTAPDAAPTTILPPGPGDPDEMAAKLAVRFAAGFELDPALRRTLVEGGGRPSSDPATLLRHAMIRGDVLGPEAGLEALAPVDAAMASWQARWGSEEVRAQLASDRDVVRDALTRLRDQGPWPDASDPGVSALIPRHGFSAQILDASGLPNDHPRRAPLVRGASRLLAATGLAVVVGIIAVAGGLVGIITFGLALPRMRRALVPPAPGGSFGIEVVAAFAAAFLGLKVLADPLATFAGADPTTFSLIAQWLVLGIVLIYPMLRGVPFVHARQLLGLHAPRGLFREIGAGIWAYFASLPLLGIAMILTILIAFAYSAASGGAPPSNPVAEAISLGTPLQLALIFLLATVWAPVTEEIVFRGAMYRHLRARARVFFAALASALFFAFMHGYAVFLLLPVLTLGAVFALMREWRGSLVAAITAHALHNGTVLTLALLFGSAIR